MMLVTELWPFEPGHFWKLSCTVGYEICVINHSHSSPWIFFKLYIHIVDIEDLQVGFDELE